jgi:hypothetical protein
LKGEREKTYLNIVIARYIKIQHRKKKKNGIILLEKQEEK